MKKMKTFKLMLVTLLAVFGFNGVNAAELVNSTQYDTNGFQYVIKSLTKTGGVWSGSVIMKQNTFSGTSITINPTVYITVEGEVSGDPCKGTIAFDIVEIAPDGFKGLSSVTSITFAEGCKITDIGAGAFDGTKITDLDLTKTKITTLNKLFENNNVDLKTVKLPATLTSLADNALANCIQLNSVDFSLCTELATLGAGSLSNTVVPSYNFATCVKLTDLSVSNPFVNATTTTNKNLASVTLPLKSDGKCPVTAIGTAFANCEVLATITNLEKSQITTVDTKAFENDKNLTSLEFPEALLAVNGTPFVGCAKLATLIFNSKNALVIGDGTNNIYGTAAADLAALNSLQIKVPAHSGTTKNATTATIADKALAGCTGITEVLIAEGEIFNGTINNFALREDADATVKFGDIAATATFKEETTNKWTIAGPTGTHKTTLTMGETSFADAPDGGIVGGIISQATVGKVNGLDILTAIGQAEIIKFAGNITGVTLAAPTAPNAALTTLDFGTTEGEDAVEISAGAIGANIFNETNAPGLLNVTWKPADAKATKAFAQNAFGAASVGAAAKVTLHTTTAVGDGKYSLLESNLWNVIFDATAAPAVPEEIEVYGTPTADYFYGKMKINKLLAIDKVNEDGDQVEVYSAFVDSKDQKIYMDRLALKDGKYIVKKNEVVIIRVKNPTTTEDWDKVAGAKKAIVKAYTTTEFNTMRYVQTAPSVFNVLNALQMTNKIFSSDYIGTNYVGKTLYAMANPGKIGTLQFDKVEKASYLPANAVFVETEEATAARLEIEWLTNEEATGIIENIMSRESNDDAIYNLQGVRVKGAQKGVYIQNGKKIIVK